MLWSSLYILSVIIVEPDPKTPLRAFSISATSIALPQKKCRNALSCKESGFVSKSPPERLMPVRGKTPAGHNGIHFWGAFAILSMETPTIRDYLFLGIQLYEDL